MIAAIDFPAWLYFAAALVLLAPPSVVFVIVLRALVRGLRGAR